MANKTQRSYPPLDLTLEGEGGVAAQQWPGAALALPSRAHFHSVHPHPRYAHHEPQK